VLGEGTCGCNLHHWFFHAAVMRLYDPITTLIVVLGLAIITGQFFRSHGGEACTGYVLFGKNMNIECNSSDEEEK